MHSAELPLATKLLIVVFGSVWMFAVLMLVVKAWRRPPLLAYEPRRQVPWDAHDLVLAIGSIFLIGLIAGLVLTRLHPGAQGPVDDTTTFYVNSLAELVGFGAAICLLRYQSGATLEDCGFSAKDLPRDLGVGLVAFVACVVPVDGLNALLEWRFQIKYTHPLIEAVRAHSDWSMFFATAVAALIVAPLFEEFVFRVLLQGWLEAVEARHRAARQREVGPDTSWWPIVVSSVLFAAMHWANGLGAIPLFFFALLLGYLYQRTHRIWPSLTAHFLLNAMSMGFLWWQIRHPGA